MASQWFISFAIVCLVRLGCTGRILPLDNQHALDNYYKNALLGLSIEKPDRWYKMTDDELKSIFQAATGPLLSNNNITSDNVIPLFAFSKYQLGIQIGKFNPNINGVVSKLTDEGMKESECDSFISSHKLLEGTQLTTTNISNCAEVIFDGKTFFSQISHLSVNGMNFTQVQYVRSSKHNYFFTFTMDYDDEISKSELDNTMKSLKFSDE
ncbi:unnamed protein product [Adineta steineri]|uniref:Uncharacterized protein n=1 Tax=Adineta steineri TaxID=433720 RepID=A0A816F6X3_9BILA|nr:unnamed protein product [Adineta steineri]CAF1543850.1 unnamed protein product [Adineta steineri]CAF1658566.1 unnamed protein product [Adineta steineri]CAF1658575.1 unnamed protein product [Adineta steineri]